MKASAKQQQQLKFQRVPPMYTAVQRKAKKAKQPGATVETVSCEAAASYTSQLSRKRQVFKIEHSQILLLQSV